MTDFWISCGHHLLDRSESGGLTVTDALIKAYLARPELLPPAEACDAERRLHASLMAAPRRAVAPAEIAALQDADARENWQLVLAFRDGLLAHPTLEAAYVALVHRGTGGTPPLFLDQLVHVILRNALDGCDDPWVLRAGELFFRTQRVTLHEGSLLAADEERIAGTRPGAVSPLVGMLGIERSAEIDVLTDANADHYWARSDRFDLALDLTAGRRGVAALGTVIERWIAHLLGIAVTVEPLPALRDAPLTWYVGLDAEATRIGDRLWHGEALDAETERRLIALYRLTVQDAALVDARLRGEPIYLMLAMTPDKVLRLKPQNLVTGLPLGQRALPA